MKATLTFNLSEPDEQQAHRRAVNSLNAYLALHEIGEHIFRPARKHGYADQGIQQYLDHENRQLADACEDIINRLEKSFYAILEEYDVNLTRDIS